MKQRQTHAGSLQMKYTARVYVNRKTRIKRAKNRMQLRLKKKRARQKIARARTTLKHQPH